MAKRRRRKLNKSQAIRDYLATHPSATPSVIQEASRKGAQGQRLADQSGQVPTRLSEAQAEASCDGGSASRQPTAGRGCRDALGRQGDRGQVGRRGQGQGSPNATGEVAVGAAGISVTWMPGIAVYSGAKPRPSPLARRKEPPP